LGSLAFSQGYKIDIKVKGLQSQKCRLAYYFQNKTLLKDTTFSDAFGNISFKGKEPLPNGIYLIVLANDMYTEFIVSDKEQAFAIETDTTFSPSLIKFKGSRENEIFYDFNRFAAVKGREATKLQNELKTEADETKKAVLKAQMKAIDKEVAEKRKEIVRTNSDLFIGKVFKSMIELDIPEPPINKDGSIDSNFKFDYFRAHYWDNFDFSEDGFIRTPLYPNKMEYYLTKMFVQIPDSIILGIESLLSKMNSAKIPELFKFTVWWSTNHYEESKVMCMDKVLHHMATNYYCAGRCFWADSALITKMCEHASRIAPTLCGRTAPDLTLIDTLMRPQTLSLINSPVTIVAFWDHQCGHCKKEIPALQAFYDTMASKGVYVYAVYTQGDWEGWKSFIREHKLSFTNVANQYGRSDFREKYNIQTTPEVFVLDHNKIIRFKKVGIENMPGIVDYLLDEYQDEMKKK
jgi:peroxiredoxin